MTKRSRAAKGVAAGAAVAPPGVAVAVVRPPVAAVAAEVVIGAEPERARHLVDRQVEEAA